MFWSSKHKKQLEVHKFVSRLLSRSDPTLATAGLEVRQEDRYLRTFAIAVAAYEDGQLAIDKTVRAVTKNVSSHGIAILLPEPLEADEVAIAFWVDGESRVVSGEVKSNVAVGGGFWQLGVELTELLEPRPTSPEEKLLSVVEMFYTEFAETAGAT